MSNIVLKAENISKQYGLGQLGNGIISRNPKSDMSKLYDKQDPYLKGSLSKLITSRDNKI